MSQHPRHIFFVGIGGIGMSALARYFKDNGYRVSGYDKTPSPLTDKLVNEGIEVIFVDDPAAYTFEKHPENFAVYTPAVPKESKWMKFFRDQSIVLKKRSEILGEITAQTTSLAIAGTHGKTTTSCLLAHLLNVGKIPAVSILGGVSTNLGSNYFNTLEAGDPQISVTEADEYDRSFLRLSPTYAGITSIDADHLEIYGNAENMGSGFLEFAKKVRPNGVLFIHHNTSSFFSKSGISYTSYGIDVGDIQANNLSIQNSEYHFDLRFQDTTLSNLTLGIPGRHNVENAIVASAIAREVGVSEEDLRIGLKTFQGVKRRFEFVLHKPLVFIDDYAHHPSELDAIIGSVKDMYPTRKITGIFQPHLYSRTKDFAQEFGRSLSKLDQLYLLDIYPAREEPIPGISSQTILNFFTGENGEIISKEAVVEKMGREVPEVLLTLGAGDIDRIVPKLKIALTQ